MIQLFLSQLGFGRAVSSVLYSDSADLGSLGLLEYHVPEIDQGDLVTFQ